MYVCGYICTFLDTFVGIFLSKPFKTSNWFINMKKLAHETNKVQNMLKIEPNKQDTIWEHTKWPKATKISKHPEH